MSALLSALGVVMLLIGSLVEVMDLSMAVIASVFCIFAVIEYGGSYPWLIYAVTGTVSLILTPQKSAAAVYLLFFGFYPIIKEKLERLKGLPAWLLKETVFNIALAAMLLVSRLMFVAEGADPWYMYLILVILAELAFPLYDIALTRMITLYICKIRPRFKNFK